MTEVRTLFETLTDKQRGLIVCAMAASGWTRAAIAKAVHLSEAEVTLLLATPRPTLSLGQRRKAGT